MARAWAQIQHVWYVRHSFSASTYAHCITDESQHRNISPLVLLGALPALVLSTMLSHRSVEASDSFKPMCTFENTLDKN